MSTSRRKGQVYMEQDEINKIVEGEPTDDQVTELESKLSDAGKKSLKELLAIKAQRKAEEKRAAEAKAQADLEAQRAEGAKSSIDQFRTEQISKAKEKFFADRSIKPEERAEYDTIFTQIDSGKVDPDLIYQDLERAYAVKNSSRLIQIERERQQMEREAEERIKNDAAGGSTPPPGNQPPKFSDQVLKMAQESGITPEAADRIAKEGHHRIIG